jgi:hypothetical protein
MRKPHYRYLISIFLIICTACQPQVRLPHQDEPTELSPSFTSLPSQTSTQTLPPHPTLAPRPSSTPTAIPSQTPSPSPVPAPIRALRVDYPDFTNSRSQLVDWEQLLKAAGINMVGLGAGRVEWTYFKWAEHESNWSSPVRDTGVDYLMEDSLRFGQWANVNAVVDVFSPNYIKTHPGTAAIRVDGVPSTDLVSTSELTTGEFGRQLQSMIEYIAANYPVDSISLTELFYHIDGYGPDDKALYMAYSGNPDWPRNQDGTIAINDKSIGDWRTHALDVYLDQIIQACHKHGKLFFLDVGLTLDYGFTPESLSHITNEHGTNYNVVLEHTDKIIIWGYFALDNFQPEFLEEVARFLASYEQGRVILSIGLWGRSSPVVSANQLERAVLASQAGGISDLWITPGSLMTSDHWNVLDALWGSQALP